MQDTIGTFAQKPVGKNNNKFVLIVVLAVIVAAVSAGIYLRQHPQEKKEQVNKIPTEAPVVSPTSEPEADKSSVKIEVINGTGKPGQAGDVVKMLIEVGFKQDNIKTGNAEEFDQTSTMIKAKSGFDKTVNDIKKSLEATFDKVRIDSKSLEKDNNFDIIITTGGKIFASPTPVSSSTPTLTQTPSPTSTTTPTSTATPSPTPN
ncbi:hypothetical protein B6D29_03005 [Microgenomates bacterium UTCPR1]|nr:MAG: hypothetical protein B6D29_03005 [Microgenomates bacterium UTCPR1]